MAFFVNNEPLDVYAVKGFILFSLWHKNCDKLALQSKQRQGTMLTVQHQLLNRHAIPLIYDIVPNAKFLQVILSCAYCNVFKSITLFTDPWLMRI